MWKRGVGARLHQGVERERPAELADDRADREGELHLGLAGPDPRQRVRAGCVGECGRSGELLDLVRSLDQAQPPDLGRDIDQLACARARGDDLRRVEAEVAFLDTELRQSGQRLRVGPSTGLPTRTAQGDLLQAAFLSHGDTKHIMIIPSSVDEAYAFAMEAFDLAEQFQTPVFVMMDLDLGMNNWMSEPFQYPTKPINRGKLLTPAKLTELGEWGRACDRASQRR